MWKLEEEHREERICCSLAITRAVDEHFSLVNIIIFELTGMILYSITTLTSFGFIDIQYTFLAIIGMLASFCWCGRFTGAVLNPAIVFAHLIKKENRMPGIKAVFYLTMQFLGAHIGTLIAWNCLTAQPSAQFTDVLDVGQMMKVFGGNILGSFIYTMVLLIMISTDVTFTEIDLQTWFALSLSLVTICELTSSPYGVNPAFGFAFQFWYCYYNGNFLTMEYSWATITGPIIGSIIAAIFFELVFRPIARVYKSELLEDEVGLQNKLAELSGRQQEFKRKGSILELV